MIKKLTPNDIKRCFEGVTITQYCNGLQDVDYDTLLQELNSDSIALANLVKTELSDILEFDVSSFIKEKQAQDGVATQLVMQFTFRVASIKEKFTYAVQQDGYDKFIANLSGLTYLISEGIKAVNELNRLVAEEQNSKGSSVIITYKWGITDRFCRVSYWDYDKLNIRLSKPSILLLIDLAESGQLEEYVKNTNWECSIAQFIKEFNKQSIHEKISAVMHSNSIEKILTDGMLSPEDIVAYIKKNKDQRGSQEFRAVEVINELGVFVVVTSWDVDYTRKKITISIADDKVFDVENNRFTTDTDIVGRVEKRVNIGKQLEVTIFGTAA